MEINQKYSKKCYWDARFNDEESYEWIAEFEEFGCGNSQLSQQLFDKGYKNITNLDFSSVIVNKGNICNPHFNWICDDMRTLSNIESNSFDIVLEKAAIESLTTRDRSPWSYSQETLDDLENIFKSIQRVLKTGGKYISISFTQPHFRIPHMLKHPFWDVNVEIFGSHFHFFIFTSILGKLPSNDIIEKYKNFLNNQTNNNSGLVISEKKLNTIQYNDELEEDDNTILQWLTL